MKCLLEKSTPLEIIRGLMKVDAKAAKINDKAPYLRGSVSNYTKDLVMVFPMLCDNSLPPSTASMISKANERNIVTMLELLFSSAQFKGTDGIEVLSRIHKNINASMSMDDYIDALEKITNNALSKTVESTNYSSIEREMVRELKTPQKSFPVNSFSERSLNDYTVYNMNGRSVVKEDMLDNAIFNSDNQEELDQYNRKFDAIYRKDQIYRQRNQMKHDEENLQLQNSRLRGQEARDSEMHPLKRTNISKQNMDVEFNLLSKQLMDNDVKKANEMVPTLMIVRYNELNSDGNIYDQRSFVAGVKSRLISTDSMDIVERVIAKNKTKVSFLNLIRATTGEIGLVKDFLLCVDQAKIDAKNSVKKGEAAKMWKVLENLSIKNNWNKLRRAGNDASCITTLVLNQETVNVLKKEYDFDIEKISNAKMIMNTYNFLGIIIADESIEVVKFLYAGNDMFEQQAYSYLEKESNDNSYKKVINLIGKMNGR